FGDFVVVARRSGHDWVVGAMTDWTPREVEIDVASFLEGSGGHLRHTMITFADGPDADRVPTSYRRDVVDVSDRPRIKVKLAPGGGWAAKISRAWVVPARGRGAGEPARP